MDSFEKKGVEKKRNKMEIMIGWDKNVHCSGTLFIIDRDTTSFVIWWAKYDSAIFIKDFL